MNFNFTFNVHDSDHLNRIEQKIGTLITQGVKIMATMAELEQELTEINSSTNEIAADIDDLVAKLAAGGLSKEETESILSQVQALRGRLQGIAATHTV